MSAKEEFDEAMNMLDVYEHLSEVHIKAVKAYVSELQAENEKLAKERESAKSQFEFFEQGWAARAREAIRNYNKLRARVEGSPKVAVLIYNDKIQHGSIGDDEETAWCAYCEYSHDSKDDLIANGLTAREVYAVPVEADEK